ncbi:MAG: putative transcriptional regulator, Crp/Fnr family [Frankiales bacterium]|nr:putative transcriptional regulator, Crp/Fnr family [Frankiales bacterium]
MPVPAAPPGGLTVEQRDAVGRSEFFRDLLPDVLDELVPAMEVSRLAPGAALFRSGHVGHRLWVVLEGRVGVTTSRRDRLLAVMEAGDVIGEVQVFDPAPWAFGATAMGRAVVASAARDDVLTWVGRHTEVSAHLLQRMARQLAVRSRAGQEPPAADAGARVAREVLALADRYTVDGVVRHALTQQQLADIVGLSRERLNKVLGELCDRRWIVVGRGHLTVLDRDALEAHAHHLPAGALVHTRGTA